MSQIVHNSGITYGNNNRNCGNTTSYNQCNISVPDEKRRILEWISPFASRERHQAVRDSRVERVGDWLLCNQNFSTWRTSEDRTAKPVLFCYGHPGAGKTYINSLVIDTLLNGIDGDSVAVAYVYCDFTIRNMQSTSAVLGSVLRQVVGALAKIPDEVQGVFEKAKRQADGCGLRLPEILDMLTKFLLSLKRAFICIDALDEFPTKQRAQLWKSLQLVVRGCPNTRLFLTGRPQIRAEVEDYFPGEADRVIIEPTEEDIKRYIEERLEGDLDKSTIDEELQADIRSVVPIRVSGIFLLVCLGMDEILAATTIYQKRQALDKMANGLGIQEAYNATLDRIKQQDSGKSKLGMAVLMWVSRCERPLLWKELSHALGVDLVAEEFTIDNVPSVRTVLACTLGLVTIDTYGPTVRLLHLTLQEYLGTSPTVFEAPQSMMAETCLTYMNSPSVRAPRRYLNISLEESPFLEYASRFWGTHVSREVTEQVKSRALQFLDGYESHVSATILLREETEWGWSGKDVSGISGLHCIAFWGIAEIATAMLENKKWDVNGRDSRGDTPLMWAVRYGHSSVVKLLLEQGDIKPDVIVQDDRTVLSFAAELGNENAVKLLLEHGGVNPNSLHSRSRPPLSYAAARGHAGVVKLLVERSDIDPHSSDSDGLTPLLLPISGAVDVVKLLLEHEGVNPDLSDSSGRTPLSFAALRGHEGVMKLLLGRGGVDPNSSDRNGLTPLLYAALSGGEDAVKLLVERGSVNPDSLDSGGPTPLPSTAISGAGSVELYLQRAGLNPRGDGGRRLLSFAAGVGDEGLVRVLLDRWDVYPDSRSRNDRTRRPFALARGPQYVNSDSSDWNDQTPLSLAASRGHEGVVKVLLDRGGVNPGSSDLYGQTPLSLAAEGGHEGVVRLLLDSEDVNPGSKDGNGQTPLSLAASGGHEGVVKVLLDRGGVNPRSSDWYGRTPLSLAATGGHEGVVKLLLDSEDVNPGSKDGNGQTPLSFAASRGHEGVVKVLLDRGGVNPRSSDWYGRTPLSLAALGGHEGVVRLFLERGDVNPDSRDNCGATPLSYAALGGHEVVVKLLLERRDVDPDPQDSGGQTPLSLAALTRHEGVVKLLLERGDVNPNLSDIHGRTPLSHAAVRGDEGIVRLLLKCKDFNPNPRGRFGRTPLFLAAFRGHSGVVKLLLERYEVNSDSPDSGGQTPLSFATLEEHEGVVKLPLEHNDVNLNSSDNDSQGLVATSVLTSTFTSIMNLLFSF